MQPGEHAGPSEASRQHLRQANAIHWRRLYVGVPLVFVLLLAARLSVTSTTTTRVSCPGHVKGCVPRTTTKKQTAPFGAQDVTVLVSAAGVILAWLVGDAVAQRQHLQLAGKL